MSRARSASWRMTVGVSVEGESWDAWVRSRPARPARKTVSARPASSATTCCSPIPAQAKDFVAQHRRGRARDRHRHEPRCLQVHPQAHGRHPRHRPHRPDPRRGARQTHLVMHGSSSVPQEWLAIIRKYGGDIKETYGVPVEEIQRGIKSGVRKINIDTDIRLAMTGAMREVFAEAAQPSSTRARRSSPPGTPHATSASCASRPSAAPATRRGSSPSAWTRWPSATAERPGHAPASPDLGCGRHARRNRA